MSIYRIFIILLFASIISVSFAFILSNPYASAVETSCTYTPDKKTAFCSTDEEDATVYRCDKQKNGTWKCAALPAELTTDDTDTPTGLKDAINKAQIDVRSEGLMGSNETSGNSGLKDSLGGGDFLKGDNILKDEQSPNIDNEPPE